MDTAMPGVGSQRPPMPRSSGRNERPSLPRNPVRAERPESVIAEPVVAPAAAVETPETVSARGTEALRRTVNIVLAVLGLIVALPIMIVIAAVIRITSRGPVFYTQTRVGLDRRWSRDNAQNRRRAADIGGAPFQIYKFRTMRVDAEKHTGAVWASQSDPRVTAVGRVLRQYRLDELPQFINVLRGDLNIVGPRPERPQLFAKLREDIAEYPLRQRAKPGITGLAQINSQYDACLEDVKRKVEFDLRYIEKQGVIEDLKIMFKTVPVILFRRGGW